MDESWVGGGSPYNEGPAVRKVSAMSPMETRSHQQSRDSGGSRGMTAGTARDSHVRLCVQMVKVSLPR